MIVKLRSSPFERGSFAIVGKFELQDTLMHRYPFTAVLHLLKMSLCYTTFQYIATAYFKNSL